ncbi:MAG TPA: flagellar basal-body MS-ring/collar protein FliF [Burkholderiaceae bacterium]|nr:flagellar basal-body MS-ring/collar protein FliF [Burkholderiaceae bacterium]
MPALPPSLLKNLLPLVLLAVGITVLVMMYFWRDQSTYKAVFGARENVPAADMMATLDAEKVPYRLHPESGQVLVPEAMLGKVRMLLAAKGVTARLPAGLELMDRNDPLGVSQFVQDVRFRRGLEGELARSIATVDAIASARVHLSIAKSSSFVVSDGEKSSASVALTMKPGRSLGPEQVASIINLVAGSVASLSPQRVSLVDQAGNLLSARIDLSNGFDAIRSSEGANRFQEEARRNVHDLLTPVLGDNNYKVSITAEVDNDRVEETREHYGDMPKVTSEAIREEQDRNRLALGVPGSLSNRPVDVPAASADKPAEDVNTARKNATSRQYAYDRSITQIKRSQGRLNKLSVAVILNSAAAPNPKTGWSKAEIVNIEGILRSGLGMDAARGDSLVVSALAFPPRAQPLQWWEERDNQIDIGTSVASGLGFLLAFLLIVRPLLKAVLKRLAFRPAPAETAPMLAAAPAELNEIVAPALAALGVDASSGPMPVVPLLDNYDLPPPGSPVDVMVDHLKVLASKEPERVAEVVKQWVQKNGRPA